MDFSVLPLHKHPEYLQDCCELINSEWKRSHTARMQSLQGSCDQLPVSLILLKGEALVGHLKLCPIPSIKSGCFVQSVVVNRADRGKGFGSVLMQRAEVYCKDKLNLSVIYLSTQGQEEFYRKLGYSECSPISIYGSFSTPPIENGPNSMGRTKGSRPDVAPTPPPMPINSTKLASSKTYMKKNI
ncbi:hypothetical protein HUJ04_013341 [Dendroctonus ponderosae]|uniref:N-acetyltransferase domain-containing protein n=2 Tax=Dendroctonus ponderosae TaxID=77166 RepID=A0AAR5Q2V7_DENPD|nr:hypothetical protein HUJ04_013341 [Dendroctonus ponderosae]KAH1006308.1 hypothetical protein HUJ05_007055 [Dendroctonus ponderosae]